MPCMMQILKLKLKIQIIMMAEMVVMMKVEAASATRSTFQPQQQEKTRKRRWRLPMHSLQLRMPPVQAPGHPSQGTVTVPQQDLRSPKFFTPGVESFKWGEFRFIPSMGRKAFSGRLLVRIIVKIPRPDAKKLMSTSKWGSSDNVIHLLKHWCVQASAFQRQSQHLTQVDFANPQPLAAFGFSPSSHAFSSSSSKSR